MAQFVKTVIPLVTAVLDQPQVVSNVFLAISSMRMLLLAKLVQETASHVVAADFVSLVPRALLKLMVLAEDALFPVLTARLQTL